MRFAFNTFQSKKDNQIWALFPGLCCQAACGNPDKALPLTASWLLFYAAAKTMDDVQDRDQVEVWWADIGPRGALSAATGLYFTASFILNNLDIYIDDSPAVLEIRKEMLVRFVEMAGGQHLDLVTPQPDLAQYWQIAVGKSGALFSMACWAGARLATDETAILQGFHGFGLQIGLLLQVLDDLNELKNLDKPISEERLASLRHSLPVIYLLETCPEREKKQIQEILDPSTNRSLNVKGIFEAVESSGGTLYILSELNQRRHLALKGLEQAKARQPAKDKLIAILDELSLSEL